MYTLIMIMHTFYSRKGRKMVRKNQELELTEIKKHLKEYVEMITEKSKGANMYICPLCHSGTGKNKTGAFSIKEDIWTCFSCNKSGDILDLIGEVEGITDYKEKLNRAKEIFNIAEGGKEYRKQAEIERKTEEPEEQEEDYRALFSEANKNINNTTYHRGLSLETLNRFKIGYVENWRHPKAPNAPATPRLIIPTSNSSYLARDTREANLIPEAQKSYTKSKVGKTHIFNLEALDNAKKPIFIVEGELDALSIIEAGGEAIGLGSTAMIKKLLEALEEKRPKQPLIIALDNDTSGTKASQELKQGLDGKKVTYFTFNPSGIYKDPNEALQKDKEHFRTNIERANSIQDEKERELKEKYLKNSTANYLQGFLNDISDSVNTPYIPTGFKTLDKVLDGGLYEGLYTIGAISSLGKTTLVTQIADQVAQMGNDVLIFSLEMARTEIMAKSISRHTIIKVLETGGDTRHAKTTRGITTGKRYINYSDAEKKLIYDSVNAYGQYSNHIYISEGIGDIGVAQIRDTVKKHIRFTGNRPTVIIDYLQILAPYNERATDKQNTDKAIMELKRISRDYKIAVIGISSFNRSNYTKEATEGAFKESGAIEYSSDVLMGLQLKGVGENGFNARKAKKQNPREVELVMIKNRNGRTGDVIEFQYYPLFNYFKEI